MRIFLIWVSVISGFKTRFFLLHPVDVISILSFKTQGRQSGGFPTLQNFCAKTQGKSMEIPVTECSLIPANMRSKFPEVDIIFDYACAFLHRELVK